MRVLLKLAVVLLVSLPGVPVQAATIGFVDAERAVATVGEGKRALAELEAWATPRRQELERLQAAAAAAVQDFEQRRAVVNEEEARQLEIQARAAARSFEDARRAFQRDSEAKQNEFLANVAVKVGAVASEYAKEKGFEAVFVLNAQPLIYVAESADLTDIVIRLYDQRFPVAP